MIYNNDTYRFRLDNRKPKKKFTCPSCGRKRTFTRYLDLKTGNMLPEQFGICDRIIKCGYHKRPTTSDIGENEVLTISSHDINKSLINRIQEYDDTIDPKEVLKYMVDYENNKLFKYLAGVFGKERTLEAFLKYRVGTINHYNWKGSCIFWQIDKDGDVRTGKIMDYNDKTGKRVKDDYPHICWYHSIECGDFNLRQCLFGEHLVNYIPKSKNVNLVESEKTAIIASICSPDSIFLATGGLQNLRPEVMGFLEDRKIIAFPDKGSAFDKWNDKVKNNLKDMNIQVSSFLEKKSNLKEGDDMADYLILKQNK